MSIETIHSPVFNDEEFTLVCRGKKHKKESRKEPPKEPTIPKKSISEQFINICRMFPRGGASVKGANFKLFYYQQPDCFTESYSVGFTIIKNRYTYVSNDMTLDTFIKFFSNKFIDEYYYSEQFDDSEFLSKVKKYSFIFIGDDCD